MGVGGVDDRSAQDRMGWAGADGGGRGWTGWTGGRGLSVSRGACVATLYTLLQLPALFISIFSTCSYML